MGRQGGSICLSEKSTALDDYCEAVGIHIRRGTQERGREGPYDML